MKSTLLAQLILCAVAAPVSAADRVDQEAFRTLSDVRDRLRALDTYVLDTEVSTRTAVGGGRYRDFKGQVRYVVDRPNTCSPMSRAMASSARCISTGS